VLSSRWRSAVADATTAGKWFCASGPELSSIVSLTRDLPERWRQAHVYPYMWADPDEDPRKGLDWEQLAHRSVPPSTM
jgi:hypothetical protein